MKHSILALAAVLGLVLALAPAASLLAVPIDYGTNIHLWVLRCPGTAKIISGHPCPNDPPTGCSCVRTWYDFPVDHPYGICRVSIGGGDGSGGSTPGVVQVLVDYDGAIQCGDSVHPSPAADGCGATFGVDPVDEWDVEVEVREAVESRLGTIEEVIGQPVEAVVYGVARSIE